MKAITKLPKYPPIDLIKFSIRKHKRVRGVNRKLFYSNITTYALEVHFAFVGLLKTLGFIKSIAKKANATEQIAKKREELEYHLGNFYLRWYLFDEKLNQLINAAYIGMTESNKDMRREVRKNIKTQNLRTELELMDNNKTIKKTRTIRTLFTHQRYQMYPSISPHIIEAIKKLEKKDPSIVVFEEFSKFQLENLSKITLIADEAFEKISKKTLEYLKSI